MTRDPLRVEIFRGIDGAWRWNMRAANNRIVATSGESFHDRRGAQRAARRFVALAVCIPPGQWH